jgi:hypothetical protein
MMNYRFIFLSELLFPNLFQPPHPRFRVTLLLEISQSQATMLVAVGLTSSRLDAALL